MCTHHKSNSQPLHGAPRRGDSSSGVFLRRVFWRRLCRTQTDWVPKEVLSRPLLTRASKIPNDGSTGHGRKPLSACSKSSQTRTWRGETPRGVLPFLAVVGTPKCGKRRRLGTPTCTCIRQSTVDDYYYYGQASYVLYFCRGNTVCFLAANVLAQFPEFFAETFAAHAGKCILCAA